MLQGGDGLSIPFEAPHELRVGGDGFVKDLDGHVAFDAGLEGPKTTPVGPASIFSRSR